MSPSAGNAAAPQPRLESQDSGATPPLALLPQPAPAAGLECEPSATVLSLESSPEFVLTAEIEALAARALRYLNAGQAVHLSGPAGTGKTALAMHLATCLGRPTVLIHGDEEFTTSDLVGAETGYDRSRVVDNFIHSVIKTEDSLRRRWVDNRLTMACKFGFVLIYDEFTRSRPEANNVLLGVLGERLLDTPRVRTGDSYVAVHPDFAAIFTSNPEEYAGVHSSQDALSDRMVTLELSGYDVETETAIVASRSGLDAEQASSVVFVVSQLRDKGLLHHRSVLRGSLVIAKVLARCGARAEPGDPVFQTTCFDVLAGRVGTDGQAREQHFKAVVQAVAACTRKPAAPRRK